MDTFKNTKRNIVTITATSGFAPNFLPSQFAYLIEKGYTLHLICNDDEKVKCFANKLGVQFMPIAIKRTLSIVEDLKTYTQLQ